MLTRCRRVRVRDACGGVRSFPLLDYYQFWNSAYSKYSFSIDCDLNYFLVMSYPNLNCSIRCCYVHHELSNLGRELRMVGANPGTYCLLARLASFVRLCAHMPRALAPLRHGLSTVTVYTNAVALS
jgi:hypothetical protein